MVIISPEQERMLAEVARRKAAYDREIDQFEQDLQALRAQRKEPIREAVRIAREAGIPDRQIHLKGLGMAQFTRMVNFLRTPAAKRALSQDFEDDLYFRRIVAPTVVASDKWEFEVIDKSGKMVEALSPDGTKYGIILLPMGKVKVMRPNRDVAGQYPDWTDELIREAKSHNAQWITVEEFESMHDEEDDTEEDED